MMPDTTEKRKKLAPILCAALVAGLLVFYILAVLFAVLEESMEDIAGLIALGIFVLILLAVVVGVLLALRQRLHEIDKGEEEEAKKY